VIHAAGFPYAQGLVLLPVVIKKKTICLLLGCYTEQPAPHHVRAPLTELAEEAAMALAELIVRRKTVPTQPIRPLRARTAPLPAEAPHKSVISDIGGPEETGGPEREPEKEAAEPEAEALEPSPESEIGAQIISTLLDQLEQGGETAQNAENALRTLGKPAVEALIARFPGRLRVDRHATRKPIPPVDECSSVLRGLAALGRPALPAVAPLLRHTDAEHRFYATYLFSELTYPEAVALVARQLHDSDAGIRQIAARVLRHFKETVHFPLVLDELRNDLSNPNPRPRRGAVEALGALGDGQAVPSLTELLRDPDTTVVESARRALVNLTKQDFGLNEKHWLIWWERNLHRKRIEWVIDGLLHSDPDIRAASSAELHEITGESFNYRVDMPLKERESIRQRYLKLLG
jgi:HEAT repeat protein